MNLLELTDQQYTVHQISQEEILKPMGRAHYAIEEALNGTRDVGRLIRHDRETALLVVDSLRYMLAQLDYELRSAGNALAPAPVADDRAFG